MIKRKLIIQHNSFQGFNFRSLNQIQQHVEVRFRKDIVVDTINGTIKACISVLKITELKLKFKLTHVYTHPHILLMVRLFNWYRFRFFIYSTKTLNLFLRILLYEKKLVKSLEYYIVYSTVFNSIKHFQNHMNIYPDKKLYLCTYLAVGMV